MTSHGLTARNILRTLPDVLRTDAKIHALASVIADALETRYAEIDKVRIYALIDELPESLLDVLAHDFKVDWYGYNYPLSVKRTQFKDSFQVRRKLGTPGAMEIALGSIYPHTDVEEWFEYGGDPYYFRVILDITGPQVSLSHEDIIRTITWFKNKRSHLQDGTVIYRSRGDVEVEVTTGYVIYNVRLCGTYPVRATQGGISRSDVVVLTGADGVPYTVPVSGENKTGTHPATATQGVIDVEDLILLTEADGVSYAVTITGTQPDRATQGAAEASSVSVGDEGGGVAYRAKMCGSTPGSLI